MLDEKQVVEKKARKHGENEGPDKVWLRGTNVIQHQVHMGNISRAEQRVRWLNKTVLRNMVVIFRV